jgi:hypothetical protein
MDHGCGRGRHDEQSRAARGCSCQGDESPGALYCCSMEVPKLTNEQQRALRVLARHTDGCAQPALLADGFSVCQFVVLVIEGFATMRRKRVDIGGREKMMIWLQITPIGQSAVAE